MINPFHATGLFLYRLKTSKVLLMFSESIETDQRHGLGEGYIVSQKTMKSIKTIKLLNLKADSRVGWPNIFKCFRVIFSLKKKNSPISAFVQSLFSTKRSPNVVNLPLTEVTPFWVFDVRNRANGFSNFQNYHNVVMYLFKSLAKSCTLFWIYS